MCSFRISESLEFRACDLTTFALRGLLELRPVLEKLIGHNSTFKQIIRTSRLRRAGFGFVLLALCLRFFQLRSLMLMLAADEFLFRGSRIKRGSIEFRVSSC